MTIGTIDIQGRRIGEGFPTYIIAELSANHGHDFEMAASLVRAAKESGADAVKLQTYTADTLTLDCDKECFRLRGGTLWDGRSLHDLYREAYMPWDWQPRLKSLAEEIGIQMFSTPFDDQAVDFLESINVPAHKVASFELVDHGLIQRIARTGKPMIMSTGMAELSEIAEAVGVARNAGCDSLALLKCTSAYPAPPEEANLRTIPHLANAFGVPAGLSDHTLGISVPVAAVALGACIVEKHFTLSRNTPGPDSAFSLEPEEFRQLVASIRSAESAVGDVTYGITDREAASRRFRRSLFAVRDVRRGEPFTSENIRSIRPGHGLPPKYLPEVLDRLAVQDIQRGTPLNWSHVMSPR